MRQPAPATWQDMQPRLGVDREAVLSHIRQMARGRRVFAVYLGGSLADGYGNARSDVDLYALSEGTVSDATSLLPIEVARVQGWNLQCEFVDYSALSEAIAHVEGGGAASTLQPGWTVVLHRLSHSAVLHGEELVEKLRDRLSAAGFRRLMATARQNLAENALQDAYGACEAHQYQTATYNLRLAGHRAFEAVLALGGWTAPNEKWVFEKASRALPPGHSMRAAFECLFQCMPSAFDESGWTSYAEPWLAFVQRCHDVATACQVWPEQRDGRMSGLAQALLQGTASLVRAPHFLVRHLDDKIVVYEHLIPRHVLSQAAACVWLCFGVAEDIDAAVHTARVIHPELFEGVDCASLATRLRSTWTARGMLREVPPTNVPNALHVATAAT